MNRLILGGVAMAVGAIGALSLPASTAYAGDNPFTEEVFISPDQYEKDPPVSGKMAADNCSACHGTQGRIFNEIIPPLAGMPKQTFVDLMMRFKQEKRPTIIMNKVARAFTDGEIERMGEYFASQPAKPWRPAEAGGE